MKVDVCIATYKRPVLLEALLNSLFDQKTDDNFLFRIIVVDNDREETARAVVERLVQNSPVDIIYDVEPQQNISLVRNKAISHVNADFLVFIDDDEYAEPDWLMAHLTAAKQYDADVVFGPVLPVYPENTPDWIKKGKFFERKRCKTGEIRPHGATNNTFVKYQSIKKMNTYFDPEFGLTGGGDTEFFWRMGNNGAKMIWCDLAIVHEKVPVSRMTQKWLIRRAYRGGQVFSRIFCKDMSSFKKILWLGKRCLYLIVACLYLPLAVCLGKSKRVFAMQKFYSCLGQLTMLTGFYYKEYKLIK
jgi:succinoglycan biosynthesis protein ExoM